jgi:hypothetical protein
LLPGVETLAGFQAGYRICRATSRHGHDVLAGVHLNLTRYDRRRIDGVWMNNSDVTAV